MKIGEKVPETELDVFHNNEIKKIKLSDYKGKWLILLFYPADFTFICPTELSEMSKYYDEVKSLGGEVISVSVDTAFVHKAWHDSSPSIKVINYPMGADPGGKLCKEFGTYGEKDCLSIRATFILDPEGTVKSIEMHDNSIGRNSKEILRKLKAAKFVSENPGQVCPASWEPGGKTLKPGMDLVGKL